MSVNLLGGGISSYAFLAFYGHTNLLITMKIFCADPDWQWREQDAGFKFLYTNAVNGF